MSALGGVDVELDALPTNQVLDVYQSNPNCKKELPFQPDDDDDDIDEDQYFARVERLPTGPFELVPELKSVKITFVAGIDKRAALPNLKHGDAGSFVTISWADVLKAAETAGVATKIAGYDPTRCVPKSVRVIGTNMGKWAHHFCLELYDNSRPAKAMHTTIGYKNASGTSAYTSGMPLFLLEHTKNKVLMKPERVDADQASYWNSNLDLLKKSMQRWTHPVTNEVFMIGARNSRGAAMLHYSLSVKNQCIPNLLTNPQYSVPGETNLLKVPEKYYVAAYNAYERKFKEMQAKAYDFSQFTIHLKPLRNSADFFEKHPFPGGSLAIELVMVMALRVVDDDDDDLAAKGARGPALIARRDEDDDDDEF